MLHPQPDTCLRALTCNEQVSCIEANGCSVEGCCLSHVPPDGVQALPSPRQVFALNLHQFTTGLSHIYASLRKCTHLHCRNPSGPLHGPQLIMTCPVPRAWPAAGCRAAASSTEPQGPKPFPLVWGLPWGPRKWGPGKSLAGAGVPPQGRNQGARWGGGGSPRLDPPPPDGYRFPVVPEVR